MSLGKFMQGKTLALIKTTLFTEQIMSFQNTAYALA